MSSPFATGAAGLRLVVLGDSIASGSEASDGPTFGVPAAAAVEALSGRSVELTNLADASLASADLLQRVLHSATMRTAIAGADIVTITVGGNDADPFADHPAGTCAAGGDGRTCLAAYAPDLEKNLDGIVAEILVLRAGQPTAIRITSPDYNPFIGLTSSPDLPAFDPQFGLTFYRQVAEAETAAACAVAQRHGALCVDFYHAFNGADGTQDAAPFLAADHLHPSPTGQQRIADLLVAAGFAPLTLSAN
jgi:lysophospholipase L1-like esterase